MTRVEIEESVAKALMKELASCYNLAVSCADNAGMLADRLEHAWTYPQVDQLSNALRSCSDDFRDVADNIPQINKSLRRLMDSFQ